MTKRISLVAVAALASIAAFSPANAGFYGSVTVGGQSTKPIDGTFFAPAGTFSGSDETVDAESVTSQAIPAGSDTLGLRFKTKTTFAATAEVGYDFGMVRAGVEVSYGRNKVNSARLDSINGSAVTLTDEDAQDVCDFFSEDPGSLTCSANGNSFNVSGGTFAKIRQLSAMANVWVDIPVGAFPVKPYLGGGVGVSGYHVAIGDGESDGKARFAWQLGAGVSVPVSSKVSVVAGYRYRQVKGATLFADSGEGLALGKLKTHLFTAGIGVGF